MSGFSNLPVEQALIRLEEKFDGFNKKLQDLTADSELWATRYLKNVAGEVLLWAYGDQLGTGGIPSNRFQNLARDSDSRLAAYASALPLKADLTSLGPALDGVINQRNSTVHFGDVKGLQQGVHDVLDLLARHPARCQQEVMVIDSFADLISACSV